MSKVWKGVKKVFKKVGKFVKKHWKKIALAAGLYFGVGIALSSFSSTAGFASSMPGFGTGGLFSKAAAAMGFQGAAGSGIANTIAANAAGSGLSAAGYQMGSFSAEAGAGGVTSGFAMPGSQAAAAQNLAQASTGLAELAPAATGAAATGTEAMLKAMSSLQKIQLLQTGLQMAGGYFAETPEEAHARQYQSVLGVDREGNQQDVSGIIPKHFGQTFAQQSQQQAPVAGNPFSEPMQPSDQSPAGPSQVRRSGAGAGDSMNPFGGVA